MSRKGRVWPLFMERILVRWCESYTDYTVVVVIAGYVIGSCSC